MTQQVALVVAATVSVVGALVSAFFANRLARSSSLERADQLAVRFREPLLQAAFNLQSRLYNIARQDFLGEFTGPRATAAEQEYAVRSTQFLVGQYLGWVEVIRRESQYIDPRSRERNRAIAERLEQVRVTLADSRLLTDPVLRLFRGEQRAVGEMMLVTGGPGGAEVPRWECKGYARFVQDLEEDQRVGRWFAPIERDVRVLAARPGAGAERLARLQHDLLDLVAVLDPSRERIPVTQLERV